MGIELKRPMVMVLLAMIGATVLWMLGYNGAAVAAVATLPVALFNRWFVLRALDSDPDGGRVMIRSLVRTVVSILALLLGYQFGLEVMLGVLLGLTYETLTYFGDAVKVLTGRRGA